LGVLGLTALALGQSPVPLADPVEKALTPSGISSLPVAMNGRVVYVFSDPSGEDVLHFIGNFVLTLGGESGQELRAREGVVWLSSREHAGVTYRHMEILLWRDAHIREPGGTVTGGPALYVTLNTTGEIKTQADDVAFQSSIGNRVYQEGARLRQEALPRIEATQDEYVLMRIVDASQVAKPDEEPKPRPIVQFSSRGEFSMADSGTDRQVLTVTAGVYLARGVSGGDDFLEIQADSAVVFLPPGKTIPGGRSGGEAGLGTDPTAPTQAADESMPPTSQSDRPQRKPSDQQLMTSALGDIEVESVYLEGDVRMTQGPNSIRASRIYYDLRRDRAIILDAVVRTLIAERGVPLYLRAEQIRQLSQNEFAADEAVLTTSEFHTPHYHIGAERVELVNRTPPQAGSLASGVSAGTFRIRHATLNVGDVPIGYWPYLSGNIETSETAIRSIRTGYSDDFGVELETKWYLFNLLGLETPTGVDGTLDLDYFSERGPAVGIDADYKRDDDFGLMRSYLIHDDEPDDLGDEREVASHSDLRGRFLVRHRQFLEEDWQLSLEVSYISDEGFLEEFFESEFDNGKEQETLLYLKKQTDNRAFTALLQTRILDFYTQTERMPDLGYFIEGESIGDGASWFSENRVGLERYRPENQTFRELLRDGELDGSGTVGRVDSRQEIGQPVDLGPWRFVPFATARGSAWDDSPEDGGLARAFGMAGVRGSMYLSRIDPTVRSSLWDIEGIRHIVKPDLVAWVGGANVSRDELYPFDETVEGIADVSGLTVGVRQRWQTKRGVGETRRSVDVFTWDLEAAVFDNADGEATTNGFASYSRPENSITRNYVNSAAVWRLNDRTALLNEINYDMSNGRIDILNVSAAVERSPRMSYLIGYRFIDESESNLLGFDLNYRMTEKHTLALREAFDLDEGKTLDFTIALIQRFPRWFTALSFAVDEAEDDFGISMSIWPEGLPQAALGSRRFTGLATTTRLEGD